MPKTGPGKSHRQSIDVFELFAMFPDDQKAEEWFVKARWPDGVHCPECGSFNVRERPSKKPQPYRCQSCRTDFSVKTGTLMHGSKLGLQKWAVAIYYMNTELKGESSMRLHRLLGVTQRTAWYLAHRIREAFESPDGLFSGPVEVDETFVGGKKKGNRREGIKTPVVGVKDRATKQVRARVTVMDKRTLQRFVKEHIEEEAKVYSDGYEAYCQVQFKTDPGFAFKIDPPFPGGLLSSDIGRRVRDGGKRTTGAWVQIPTTSDGPVRASARKSLSGLKPGFCPPF